MVVPITSAAGVIALLDEPEPELQSYALQKLNGLVDDFWAEVADSVSKIEVLFETASFPDRKLAALVASKVYFHLGEFDEALSFALGSAELFDVDKKDEYVDTVVSKAIDAYIEATSPESSTSGEASPDPRLRSIVDQMFSRCIADKDYKQALGIALETSRLDVIEEVFNVTRDQGLLAYVLEAVMGVVHALNLRNQVLHLLVKLFQSLPTPDNFSISQCYVYLNAPSLASELLSQLVEKAHNEGSSSTNTENDPLLVAYQIAFDLAESATQEFLENVRSELLTKSGGKIKEEGADATTAAQGEDVDMNEAEPSESSAEGSISRIRSILLGEESIQLYLDFLQRSNKADLPILKSTKDALDARSSVYHSAVSFANAFVNAGTTSDQFLRDNLEWLAKASNWSKFTATAALGVINKGNLKEGISILRPYLPQDGVTSSVYSEGGSLFALGLVHANHGQEVMELLKNSLKNNPAEIVQHGAALGLGAAGMATGNEEVYEELRNILYTDSAVAGEGAGYAMGLVMLGTGSEKAVEEMLQYAHDTAHEKIIRGLAMGLAMLFYGKEETADTMIDTLMSDKDAILRYGGVYTVALAYAGTGNNKAIRRLLHVAVSDVNDDVRRAAVTSLGFLLFRNPTQVPRIVQLLSESYNPHVRYGSTLALGIACAGTGLDEAIDLLEPMTKDPVDFVRQGACISLAMIFIQQNETLNPRVTSVRKTFEKIISDKHEDAMAKFGATLAQGLIDAGGRNVTISLSNRGGSSNMSAIVGMALFCQFWYWFPLAHFASLAFTPTALIGLNRDLNIPKFNFKSNVRPSIFSYPVANKPQVEKKAEKVQTAVLSTTAKAKARQIQKEKEQNNETSGEDAVMTDANATAPEKKEEEDSTMKVDEKPKTKKERKVEPSFEMLPNYSRVTPSQLKYVSFPPDSRFVPIRKVGIDSPNQSIKNQVYNSESVAGKLLGNSYLPQGASGTVTPAGNNGKSTPVSSQQTKSKSTETSTQASSVNATTASSEVRRSILNSNVGGGGGILLLIDRKPSEPFVSFSSTDDDPSKPNADGNDEVHKAATSGIDGEGNGDKELTGVADSVAAGSNSGTNQGPPPPAA